uniref:Uncharacterized protein n=1 Tax=Oryzias latipes TaxID=8090 RepID=A0A3P9HXW9_ORYLA
MYLVIACVTLYLLLSSTCLRKRDKVTQYPAKCSQHLLFSRVLDYGHAKPPGKPEQSVSSRPFLSVFNLVLILLLAGDVELNPGPQSLNTNFLNASQPLLTGLHLGLRLAGLDLHQPWLQLQLPRPSLPLLAGPTLQPAGFPPLFLAGPTPQLAGFPPPSLAGPTPQLAGFPSPSLAGPTPQLAGFPPPSLAGPTPQLAGFPPPQLAGPTSQLAGFPPPLLAGPTSQLAGFPPPQLAGPTSQLAGFPQPQLAGLPPPVLAVTKTCTHLG